MIKKSITRIAAGIFSFTLIVNTCFAVHTDKMVSAATTVKDVTSQVELLGNPFNKATFAKNVWDMQVYNNRIYLAHGDFNTNAGPIPVIYYEPSAQKFITQYTVDEEEIAQYKVMDGKLYIPGTDSRGDWNNGNFYTLEDNDQWLKNATIPNALHVFDMALYNGQLYAACGTSKTGWGEVLVSNDMGKTWTSRVPLGFTFYGSWATSLFELNQTLYASGKMMYMKPTSITTSYTKYVSMLGITDSSSARQIYSTNFANGLTSSYVYYMKKPTTFQNKLVYLNNRITTSHWLPDSMYIAKSINESTKVIFPETSAVPADLLIRGNSLYVLTNVKNSAGNYTSVVYQTTDLQTWNEVFRFNTDTFARSFEEMNGDFYFGLGCDSATVAASTGNILKVASSAYQDIPLIPVINNPSMSELTPSTAELIQTIPSSTTAPIIVDNTDSSFISNSTWTITTQSVGYYGSNILNDGTAGADQGKWAMWVPTIIESGNYQLYMRWTADSTRPAAAPLEIRYNGGVDTSKTVNQQENNGTWVLIGTYALSAGSDQYIKILCSSPGYTAADAIKLEKVN
ncbi:MAG: hypothetical protein FNP40_11375 [Dehalobacter sp. 4CP]|uniref:golvesin C-terminal-like domain-containing protein n=1 Tax=Dehalobacter sp. CP TaxID=2594474 RepID=UPI0013CB97F8|nr:hypothetical protein [Dehalobacter sp. 4CP]